MSQQLTGEQLGKVVAECRSELANFFSIVDKKYNGRNTAPGMKALKKNYIRRILFENEGQTVHWKTALTAAIKELEVTHADVVSKIDTIMKEKCFVKNKSPHTDFINPMAYKWLQYLKTDPPTG